MQTGLVTLPCGDQIAVLVATELYEWSRGLQGFRLSEDQGMLFVFPEPRILSFWMQGVSVPLDILWISPDGHVNHIVRSAPPCSVGCPKYRSFTPSKYVLEIPGGECGVHGLKVGSSLKIQY